MKKIYVLGIGPGHRDYLLKITEDIVAKADVLVGGSRALEIFADLDKEKIRITADLAAIRDYILTNYRQKVIAVLVSGDPGLYSIMNYLKKTIDPELLEVIPGISALQLAMARIKLDWQDLKIISLHGKADWNKVLMEIRANQKVGIFTDNKSSPAEISSFLLRNGVKNKQAVVFEYLSYPEERIIRGKLEELQKGNFKKLTVMVVYNEEMEL